MQITETMDLGALIERMGDAATQADAAAMRDLLVEAGHEATEDVPEDEWIALLGRAAEATLSTQSPDLEDLVREAREYLDPQHQGEGWPDPIEWDGRPLDEQAVDLTTLLDARARDGDERAAELSDALWRAAGRESAADRAMGEE